MNNHLNLFTALFFEIGDASFITQGMPGPKFEADRGRGFRYLQM